MENFERIFRVNLEGPLMTSKYALTPMRAQGSGVIINVSSIASIAAATNLVAYKTSKAALNALTQTLALANARYGIRANAILPGLINTPMAIEGISAARGIAKEELIAQRDRQVPLGKDGERLGRRGGRAVPGVRRGKVHHGRAAARSTAGRARGLGNPQTRRAMAV